MKAHASRADRLIRKGGRVRQSSLSGNLQLRLGDWLRLAGQLRARLGETDAAFAWLESAYEVRWTQLPLIRIEPDFASLHSDPRFNDLLRRMGLPES